jgi:hemolysin III
MSAANWSFLGVPDPVSAATHFGALLLGILGWKILWRMCRGDRRKQLAIACFGLGTVVLYASSTLYHALPVSPDHRWVFRLIDLTAIFGLIAGTLTPTFTLLLRSRPSKYVLLGTIWAFAAAGISVKWSVPREPFGLTIGLYLGMGWLALVPIVELSQAVGLKGMMWAAGGGVCYTLGGVTDLIDWPTFAPGVFGAHELSHVFDMGGTFCHFVFMVAYVVPFGSAGSAPGLPAAQVSAPDKAQPVLGCQI